MAFGLLSRPGITTDNTGATGSDDLSLFLRLFAGEVLTAFHTKNIIVPLGMQRTITTGKSALFPVLGKAEAVYHSAGDDMLTDQNTAYTPDKDYLTTIPHNEIEVFVDDPVVAPILVAKIDEMRNHFDVRAPYANELAQALSKKVDKNALAVLFDAAVQTTPIIGGTRGTGIISHATVQSGAVAYSAANFVAWCFDVQAAMDNLGVPEEGRSVLVRPELYYALIEAAPAALNRDFSDGNGDVAKATIYQVAGLRIIKSATFGSLKTDLSAQEDPGKRPSGNYGRNWITGVGAAACGAIAFHESAFATAKMADISMEQEYILQRRSHLMVASYVMGHKAIRPEAAVAWQTSNLTLS